MKPVPEEDRMSIDKFISHCFQCSSKPRRTYKDVIFLYGTVFLDHLYLDSYKNTDIFNNFFTLIVIDPNENVIKLWTRYGPKVEVNGVYKYDFRAVDPTYIISGLLLDEIVEDSPED